MNPSVSVLMPVYNASATLPECIESVLVQTHTDFELVCVDDGSTDGSTRVIEEAKKGDRRVRLIRGGRRGIVGALNRGLKACKGEFIARMDADDIMHPDRLKAQLHYFLAGGQFDLLGTQVRMISDSGFLSSGVVRYEKWSNSLTDHVDMVRELYVESPLVHPTFFLRKQFYEDLGGYRNSPWAEDYDLIFRAHLKNAAFGKVPMTLLFWRDSAGRLIRTDRRCKRAAMFRAKVHYFLRSGILDRRGSIVIAGTGPTGRMVAALFIRRGISIGSFVDNVVGPPGRRVMGVRAYGFEGEVPEEFFRTFRSAHFIVCIGNRRGREHFIRRLEDMGYFQGRDFTRFI